MKEKPGQALQRDHVCSEIGSDQFAIGLLILLENGERCDQCLVAMYFALGLLARRTLLKRRHRATKGEVEELQHEVYELLTDKDCRRLRGYNPARGAFGSWLAAFVEHHLIDRHRKQHGEASLEEISAAAQSPHPGPEAECLKAERNATLQRAIAKQSENDRQLYDLRCDDTRTTADIAKAMGCKPEDVRKLKYKHVNRLRQAMQDAPITFSKK